jgi:hypothetical protein
MKMAETMLGVCSADFSYSYDLSHTLQYNMAPCNLQPKYAEDLPSEKRFWQTDSAEDNRVYDSLHGADADVEDANSAVCGDLFAADDVSVSDANETDRNSTCYGNGASASATESATSSAPAADEDCDRGDGQLHSTSLSSSGSALTENGRICCSLTFLALFLSILIKETLSVTTCISCYCFLYFCCAGSVMYGIRMKPSWKYVWNEFLLKKVFSDVHPDWMLFIIHGFVGQSSILVVSARIDIVNVTI